MTPGDSGGAATVNPYEAKPARPPKWVIEPVGSGLLVQFEELWRYRRMLWFLSVEGVKSRYEGYRMGFLWLFVRPLMPIFIGAFVFGGLLNVPSEGVPYFLFFLTGTTVWMLFELGTLWATRSLDMNKTLIKKVYFPRLIAPLSSVAPAVTQAGVYATLLLGSGAYYLIKDGRWYLRIGPSLLVAVLAAILAVILAVAVGLWTSVWQVRFREVRYTMRYVLRFWNYLTPVLYPLSEVPERHRWIVLMNPMTPIVESFKWAVLGVGELHVGSMFSGLGVLVVLLSGGVWYFHRSEGHSVDKL